MSHDWLVVSLKSPLLSFGDVAIDQFGPTRDFPSASMLTGLFANALGWHWSDRAAHQALQDRLVFGVRSDSTATLLTDVQNAQLSKNEKAWTTLGIPAGRDGASYGAPHRRTREYLVDQATTVVVRLESPEEEPTLELIATALDQPMRPLYIGRKPCLPASRMMSGWVNAKTVHEALAALPGPDRFLAFWPNGEGPESGEDVNRVFEIADLRNWNTGLHSGSRQIVEGRVQCAGKP